MTEEDKKLLNTFEGKLRHFMYLYEEQQKENASLRQLLAEKEYQHSALYALRLALSRYGELTHIREFLYPKFRSILV